MIFFVVYFQPNKKKAKAKRKERCHAKSMMRTQANGRLKYTLSMCLLIWNFFFFLPSQTLFGREASYQPEHLYGAVAGTCKFGVACIRSGSG